MKLPPLVLLLLFLLQASCRESAREGPPPATRESRTEKGIAARFEGVQVPKDLVEPFVPFILSLRPSLAADSARRFILLRYALPMAWALQEEPRGFERSRAQAEKWLREIRRGKTSLKEILKNQLQGFGEDPSQARPVTTSWTTLPVPLAKAVLSAQKGRVEGPVRVPQGWCLFMVEKITPGLTRDQDLVTLLEVVAPPGGKAFWDKLRKFTRRLAGTRGGIEVLDPSYENVVPFIMQRRRPSSRPTKPVDAPKEKKR